MQIKGIDHIGIRVMDVVRSIRFYHKLGFQVTREDHQEHVFVVKHPSGAEINLIETGNDDFNGKNVLMDEDKKYPGYTHYAIEVDSVDSTKAFLESIAVTISGGPSTFGDGKTSIFVRDPDFNVIEFTQKPRY
ncbi:MAG: VOC family protein [Cyanobacteria bacterium P01_E01_bin.6]